jgi:hypothetical protein
MLNRTLQPELQSIDKIDFVIQVVMFYLASCFAK